MPENTQSDTNLERLKLSIGLVKFLIGTVAIGVVTLYFNHQDKNAQIELEEKKNQHAEERQAGRSRLGVFAKSRRTE